MNVTYALPRHPEVVSPGVEEAFLLSGHVLEWPNFLGGEQRVDAHRGARDVRRRTLMGAGKLRYSAVGLWFLSEAFDLTFVQALATPAKLLYTFGKEVMGLPLPGPPPGAPEEEEHDLRSEEERRLSTKSTKELLVRFKKSNSLLLPFNEIIEVSQQTVERGRGLRGFLKAKDISSKYLTYLVITHEDSNRTAFAYTFKEEHREVEGDHAFFLIWLRVHADLRALANVIRHESVDVPAILQSVVERYRETYGPNFGEKHWQAFDRELTATVESHCRETGLSTERLASSLLERLSPLLPHLKDLMQLTPRAGLRRRPRVEGAGRSPFASVAPVSLESIEATARGDPMSGWKPAPWTLVEAASALPLSTWNSLRRSGLDRLNPSP